MGLAEADQDARRNGKYDKPVSIPLDPKTALKALLATPLPEANGKPDPKPRKKRTTRSK